MFGLNVLEPVFED